MSMMQEEKHHHQSYHYQQHQEQQEHQQQPLRQQDHGVHTTSILAPPQNYYYFHENDNNIGHHSDALATSSTNMYPMQQQQQQQQQRRQHQQQKQQQQQEPAAHITLSGSTTVPMTTNVYHDDNYNNSPRMIDDNITTSAVARSSLAERNQLPSSEEFETIVKGYLYNLSSKKRDKALIDRHRYSLIVKVLKDPKNTANSTAQFRFWVKKMFQLMPLYGDIEVVCHESKPVAMREDIYAILVQAHREANHGGRDKTSALVRRRYSWIPKELIARFVRYCPFCISRRNGSSSPTISLLPRTPPDYTMCSSSSAATADATVQGNSYSTQPLQTTGLPYPMQLKSGSSENDHLGITNKNNIHNLPRCDRNQHHHLQHQQQYFYSPIQSSIGTTVASPATTPISGPISVDFCVTSSTNSSTAALPSSTQEVSSCSDISPVPFEAPNTFFHQPALISQCDITSFGYSNTSADVSANGYVNHSPSYNAMCYTASGGPDNTLPMTANTPPQAQTPQFHEGLQQRSNDSSTVESYYYTASQQPQKQNDIFYENITDNNKRSDMTRKKLRRNRTNCDAVVLHHSLYPPSSPSPSSSFSSSSSSSASSTSSPISPTDSIANTTFNTVKTTSSCNHYDTQSMYMQHPRSSTTTLTTITASPEALGFIDHHQQQQQRQF